ncbi:MAG: competence protein CoiA family protein [Candidatus Delongbacteria bacterium]
MKDGKLVQISEVEQGQNCGCVCPSCGRPLLARKGDIKIHHFAHLNNVECIGATETALHMKAKEIIEKYKTLRIPRVTATDEATDESPDHFILHEAQKITCDKVYLEKRLDDFVPDIIIESSGKQLIVEIAVTHFINSEKLNKINNQNISVLEIDLSKFDRQVTTDDLLTEIYEDTNNKKWIYNSKREAVVRKFRKLHRKLQIFHKNTDSVLCPLKAQENSKGKFVTIDKCNQCKYCCGLEDNLEPDREHIICVGHDKRQYEEIFEKYKISQKKNSNML